MKKVFLTAVMSLMMCIGAYAQDVNVSINNQDATVNEECAYRINGICTSEDIGGVDVEFVRRNEIDDDVYRKYKHDLYVVFTNYNDFPVTVLCETKFDDWNICCEKTHNIVLGAKGTKEILLKKENSGTFKANIGETIKGIIVRKLAK